MSYVQNLKSGDFGMSYAINIYQPLYLATDLSPTEINLYPTSLGGKAPTKGCHCHQMHAHEVTQTNTSHMCNI
jgi:hypothetical protein